MKQAATLTTMLLLALSTLGAPPRRAVLRPLPPSTVPQVFTSWTIEVKTAGGFAPSIRTSIVIRSSGAVTLLDYRDARGEPGDFERRLRVYGREGQPCLVCHRPVTRIVQGGRSTFFCGHCRRPPKRPS